MTNIKTTDSNVYNWHRSCFNKKKMRFEHAEQVIKRARREGNYLRSYLCPICLNYHVTKKPNKGGKNE